MLSRRGGWGRRRLAAAVAAATAATAAALAGAPAVGAGRAAAATDSPVRFERPSVLASEGERRIVLRVERTQALSVEAVQAGFHTEDVDALATSDYEASRGDVEIRVGQLFTTITIPIVDDRQFESHERFHVLLTHAHDSTRVLDRATVEVVDDDDQLSNEEIDFPEGAPGAATPPPASGGTVSVTRRAASTATVTAGAATGGAGARRQQAGPRKRSPSPRTDRVTRFQLQPPAESQTGDGTTRPADVLAVVAAAAFATVLGKLWFWRRTTLAAPRR